MIRCVVFDYGQVLAAPADLYTAGAAALGTDPATYEAHYWKDRRAYDEGASDAAYWTPLLKALEKPTTPEMIRRMAELDAQLWLEMRPEANQLLRDVRKAGRLVAILSNAPFSLDRAFVDAPFADDADYWFVSASMGVTKPSPATYYRVEDVTELPPDELAFIDDRPENVFAARARGWNAHLFVDDSDTRKWLVEIGVLAG